MKFTTEVLQTGKTTTGLVVPDEVVEALGGGKRPKVSVTINGKTYRTSVASMGGRYLVGVSAENRALTGVSGGEVVEVDLEIDDGPRVVEVPTDLAAALAKDPAAKEVWEGLSYSHQSQHALAIEAAKQPETRARRVTKALKMLREKGTRTR